MVAKLPVAVRVPAVVAAELVGAGNVNDQMPVTTKVDILDEEVAATGLAADLPHRRHVASLCDEASFMADRLQGIQNRLVGILRAAGVLPAGVDVIAVQVDDVQMAGADEGRMRLVAALAWSCRRASRSSWGIGTPRYWQNHDVHADLRCATGHERLRWKHESHADGE